MHQSLRPFSLVPSGFVVVSAVHDVANTTITVRASKVSAACPSCGTDSRRVHSRYHRRVGDLPLSGRSVELVVIARRFRCEAVLCGQQIFVERFASNVLAPSARRTGRLDCIVHHLGLALGGRPAASFARRLMLPVSNDTLLRVIRRRAHVPTEPLSVIGIDDWAWRRNHRYGTIICDLERRRPVTLLPDREPATATAWLERHQEIAVVARDRGGGYGEAVTRALPHATQVADRWHLMENASRAFLDAVRKTMRQIRAAIGATTINPELLTAAERLQYEGYQRREEVNAAILALAKDNVPIKEIVRLSDTAGNSSAGSLGESGKTSFVPGRARSNGTSLGSMPSGHRDAATARISSGASKDRDFEVPSGWSLSGPPAADAQRKLMPITCNASHRHAPSRA